MAVSKEFIYNTWAVLAVQGFMREADEVLRQHKDAIYTMAQRCQRSLPVKMSPVYRGLLLQTEGVNPDTTLNSRYEVEFMSFSENKEVACLFASPESYMSAYVMSQHPDSRGYVIMHTPERKEVLFHWKWHYLMKIERDLDKIALNLTMNGLNPDFRQYMHNVRTQKEVILTPIHKAFDLIPKAQLCDLDGLELDKKYLPDFVLKEIGLKKNPNLSSRP